MADANFECSVGLTLSNESISKENARCVASILAISTKSTPPCSLSSLLLTEPNVFCLASLVVELAYVAMSLILRVMQTFGNVQNLKNK